MVKRCADGLSNTVNKIKQRMQDSAFGHFDETGSRVDKQLWWIHNASNCEYTYLDINHAVCCAHLLRELTGITENHPEQKWESTFIDLLLEMKKVKDKAIEKDKEFLSYYHYHKFDKKYDELIELHLWSALRI